MLNRIKNLFRKTEDKKPYTIDFDSIFDSLTDNPITICAGADLSSMHDVMLKNINLLREEIKEECGFVLPLTTIVDDFSIQENEIQIFIHNELIEQIYVIPTETEVVNELHETLKTVIYNNIDKLFSNELAEKYVNTVQKSNNFLIWNLTNILSIVDIKTILSEILMKGKSINNINYIFEKMCEYVLAECDYMHVGKKRNPHIISQAIAKYLYK